MAQLEHEPFGQDSRAADMAERSRMPTSIVYARDVLGLGRLSLRPFEVEHDAAVVQRWVDHERSKYWGMLGHSPEQVQRAYRDILQRADVYLGYHDLEPAFLVEAYAPERDLIGQYYEVAPGDRGMHVLVAPPEIRIHGFTWQVFRSVMEFLFSDAATQRIVVEPDVRNRAIHVLNRRAGFRYRDLLELPHKTAHLAFCTRADYARALEPKSTRRAKHEGSLERANHLQPELWERTNRALITKAISEFCHERLLEPARLELPAGQGSGTWALSTDSAGVQYRFRARVLELQHWDIDPASLEKLTPAGAAPLDALQFVLEFSERLGMPKDVLPVYLEEIASTLYAAAHKAANARESAFDLVHAEFQDLEAAMFQGHPAFVANNGRVGFDAVDHLAYAPEAGAPVRLVWLAAARRHAEFNCSRELSYQALMAEELGASSLAAFERKLLQLGLQPRDYLFIPVHPWQWFNRLAITFAGDIARRDLVCLGCGADEYGAQQSVRTFFNVTRPERRYVKTALSVLNMGFMRGLSAEYMRNTPAINDWVLELLAQDPYFAEQGFSVLREVAAVGYRHPHFQALPPSSPYRKMLAALWRESPVPSLRSGERLMTMAALLHRDHFGVALLPQLIRASGAGIDTWLDRYLGCYLAPLLHCFYRHDLAFMPHGENIILVLKHHLPERALLKDIAEEAVIMDPERPLPPAVQRLRAQVPDDVKLLAIFTDVFDGILRYISQILLSECGYTEARFWRRVAACVHQYRRRHPELAPKFALHDPFTPQFLHSCLNRLQIVNNRQMVDLADPAKSLRFAGTLENPIARFRDET